MKKGSEKIAKAARNYARNHADDIIEKIAEYATEKLSEVFDVNDKGLSSGSQRHMTLRGKNNPIDAIQTVAEHIFDGNDNKIEDMKEKAQVLGEGFAKVHDRIVQKSMDNFKEQLIAEKGISSEEKTSLMEFVHNALTAQGPNHMHNLDRNKDKMALVETIIREDEAIERQKMETKAKFEKTANSPEFIKNTLINKSLFPIDSEMLKQASELGQSVASKVTADKNNKTQKPAPTPAKNNAPAATKSGLDM